MPAKKSTKAAPKKVTKETKTDLPSSGEKLADAIDPVEEHKERGEKTEAAPELVNGRPKLGPKQKYFETPDGRIYAGPDDMSSIPDPLNPGREINPMRLPTKKF